MAIYHCKQGSILCLHGGIPIHVDENTGEYEIPHITTHEYKNRHVWLDDMDDLSQQILWNDPIINYDPESMPKYYKSKRGMGYCFGEEIFDEFCELNKISLIFRGHQVFMEGIHTEFRQRFITIFSTSDYVKKKIKARFIEMNSDDIFNYKIHVIQDLP